MFNIDGRFFSIISRLGDLVILNILFLICCIPVITVGASVSAMYAVTKKMTEDKEGYILKSFFKAFKENFRQSTVLWFILLVCAVIVSVDLYICRNFMKEGLLQAFAEVFMLFALLMVFFMILYALTLQCTFENTVRNTLKNSFLISLGHAPWSILMTVLALSPFIALLCFGEFFGTELLAILLIWFSGMAYVNSFILNRIYKKYM